MLDPLYTLEAIKGRGRRSVWTRCTLAAALRVWKSLRFLPGSQLVRLNLRVDGHRYRVRLFSYDDLLTASPGYEELLKNWLPPAGGVAVDAGAFIGRHALAYAQAVGPLGQVLAFEPLPANFELLAANVRQNGLSQVTPIRAALGDHDGQLELYFDRESSTASSTPSKCAVRSVVVPLRALDGVLAESGIARVDLIKIDVEGAELSVLAGAERTIAHSDAITLVIEIHGQDTAAKVRDWLSERGLPIEEGRDGQRLFYVAAKTASRSRSIVAQNRSSGRSFLSTPNGSSISTPISSMPKKT